MKVRPKVICTLIPFALALQACSTPQGSVATGAGIGGMTGGGVGALADPGPGGDHRFRNVVIGAAAGGLVGAGAGYAIDRSNRDSKEDGKREGRKEAGEEWDRRNQSGGGGGSPDLVPPKTEAKWIPDQVRGSTFVPGHFEYSIVSPARWETKR